MDRFHLLLGRYIAKTTEIEFRIDRAIGAYFNTSGPTWSDFNDWLLARIEFSNKLAILRQIVEFLGLTEDPAIKEMFRGLTRMMQRRNDLAHGHYMQVVEVGQQGEHDAGLGRFHRDSAHLDPDELKMLGLEGLEAELVALDGLNSPLTTTFHRAFSLWTAKKDGHPGTYREVNELYKQRRDQKAEALRVQAVKEAAAKARKAARAPGNGPPKDE